jgi:pimeloyl-ACP methyl ester carboxylesterase
VTRTPSSRSRSAGSAAPPRSPGAELVLIEGGPHAINTSHAEEFNRALLAFLVD